MQHYKLDILGLSEIRWKGQGEYKHPATGYCMLFSGNDVAHTNGVGILLTPTARKSLMEHHFISDRIIMARFHSKFRNITVIQCYAPTELGEPEDKDAFYGQLDAAIARAPPRDIKIVTGDFNAKVGSDNTNLNLIMGRHALGDQCTDNGQRLIDLCASHQLFIGGTKFPHKDIHKFTWESPPPLRARNQIDHFLISRKYLGSLLDVKSITRADMYSDHKLLVGVVRLRPAAVPTLGRQKRRYNIERLKNPSTADEFATRLEINFNRGDDSWESVANAINHSAKTVLGFTRHQNKPWISEATWRQIATRRSLYAQIPLARTAAEKQHLTGEYREAEKLVKRMVRSDRRKMFTQIADAAENAAARGNMRGVYSAIKQLNGEGHKTAPPIKNQHGIPLSTEREQLDRWREFFQSTNAEEEEFIPFTRQERRNPRRDIPTAAPTVDNIISAIKKLKNNKSPGTDNLPAELFNSDPHLLASALHPIIRNVWTTCEIPDSWKEGVIITIPKKGDLRDCKNWRGITLLNTIEKVIAFIILDRIAPAIDILMRREQAGFRANRSCVDHINTLRIIVEQSVEMNSPLYLLFVDFERAFDTISRNAIWSALHHLGIPDTIVNLIRELYRDAACKVRFKGQDSDAFTINMGVRQGCVLSPILFLIVLDNVLAQTNIEAPNGIQWRPHQKLNDLDYADDICLMAHTFADIHLKLQRLEINARKVGLKINIRKTKIMRIGTNITTPLTVASETIEDVEDFCYLGGIIAKNGGSDKCVRTRINKARQAYSSLGKVWRANNISKRHKLRIFDCSVKSVLLYGCETWRVTDTTSRKLQVFVNQCLRRIMQIFYPERITNNDLLNLTHQDPIAIEIRRRKWRWIGHTLRKPDDDIAKMSFEWNPQGRRNQGRPRMTWRRSVLREASETSWLQLRRLAGNRDAWRDFVSAQCSTNGA